ncbi:hypothetical protein ACOJUR_05200 [Alicyclobacillus tolerans]|uniref:Uncharacterized protein YbaR (Trm112 family) n=2 Tax=Alicyclobacillus tolerans TaxID=90970 RepID=A0ABT9LXK4_9BACL|nr:MULTISPECIES: hypothetical protein [Alicyclobacillus]MDP9728997.1 uncharacterized protein YbaR (Trm112 family) [Alicyclobacillus tengchongensis]QRF24120.1 hypothetical protein FY534_11070 [Alicyclobacillus sp. TC]SHK77666.1 hypothetical protein SAMN05443507_12233 [Alicyclobacillus montanus]
MVSYQVPQCRECKSPLTVVEHHIHEYMRQIRPSGKADKPFKGSFRHYTNEILKCEKCGQRYLARRDELGRFLRGKKITRPIGALKL